MHPLLPRDELTRLRRCLDDFTATAVSDVLGVDGQALLARGDLAGVRRRLDTSGADRRATLVRLFLLGDDVDDSAAQRALDPLDVDAAERHGLLDRSGASVRSRVDLRPYGEAAAIETVASPPARTDAPPWWVVSDFASDIRPGPVAGDHVLGIGAAALTLAQATVRDPVGRALDVGTGCGVQALHLSRHSANVTATDLSARALQYAATTAALSDVEWDLRRGSLLEPVTGDRYDLVVANPPFVVSPGLTRERGGYDYRDGGLAGDELCRTLVRQLPAALRPGGTAQLLANWIIPLGAEWPERITGWFDGTGCDAWVWQRETADPAEYVALWLADAGHRPGTTGYREAYDSWLDWFAEQRIAAIGMGLITMWRHDDSSTDEPIVVCDDVPQALGQPVGPFLQPWHRRRRWLASATDADLLAARLVADRDLVVERADIHSGHGWTTAAPRLRQSHGLRWAVDSDEAFASVVRGCDGTAPLGAVLGLVAAVLGTDTAEVITAALPVVRDLIGRGILQPVDGR